MNDSKPNYHLHEEPHSDNDQKNYRSFWRHAHLDWRSWAFSIWMVLAMIYYVMSDDFAVRFRGRLPQTQSGSVGK